MLALIVIGGFGVTQSLGEAKLYNFSINLASLIFLQLVGICFGALDFSWPWDNLSEQILDLK